MAARAGRPQQLSVTRHEGVAAAGNAEAVALLKKARAACHRHLATLLVLKTKAGYSHTPASNADVKKAARAAAQLVDEARRETPMGS